MEDFNVRIVNLCHLCQHVIKLLVIFNHKFSLDKARTFVENEVPWLDIKLISLLKGIILLYFILNYESHVAER